MTNEIPNKVFGRIYRIYHPKLLTRNEHGRTIQLSYVGRTEKSIENRLVQHQRAAKEFQCSDKDGDGKLHAVMWANGPMSFIIEELCTASSSEELSRLEAHHQGKFQSVKYGWNKIAASSNKKLNKISIEISVNGQLCTFSSLAQMSRELKISNSTVSRGIQKMGLNLNDAVAYALIARQKTVDKSNSPIVIFHTPYASIVEASNDKNINKHKLNAKLLQSRIRKGMTPEKAFLTPLRESSKAITITAPDGSTHSFKSVSSAHGDLEAKFKVPPYSSITNRLQNKKLTPTQAFGFASPPWEEEKYVELQNLIRNEGYKIIGKPFHLGKPVAVSFVKEIYSSINEFSKAYNLDASTIAENIKKGLTPDQILKKINHYVARDKTLKQ
jgi:hypothetical protein